jgi:hypothetical protein
VFCAAEFEPKHSNSTLQHSASAHVLRCSWRIAGQGGRVINFLGSTKFPMVLHCVGESDLGELLVRMGSGRIIHGTLKVEHALN